MDVLLWIINQGGRGACLALLAYVLWSLALPLVDSGQNPTDGPLRASGHRRAPTRARGTDREAAPTAQAPTGSVPIRDGWQTTPNPDSPRPEAVLLLDLYAYLRKSWDDTCQARQTTRGLIAGGTGDPRPKTLVRAARQWARETGAGAATADRLLGQLIEAGVVARGLAATNGGRAVGWRLLRPSDASALFVRAVGVGIERSSRTPPSRP
jgi:hypothetical protein